MILATLLCFQHPSLAALDFIEASLMQPGLIALKTPDGFLA